MKKLALVILLAFGTVTHSVTAQDTAQVVHTGVYLMNLYDLDINEYSYYADFYLWFRWKGERDPMNIEFVNAVEKWGFTQNDFHEEAQVLEDGSYYNGMRIEGRFYHPFKLNRFPIDRHQLGIRIENVDYPLDSMVFLPDTGQYFFRPDLIIPGWYLKNAGQSTQENVYLTNFGEPGGAGRFSNFSFEFTIARPLSYFLLKLLLPLLVVIFAALGALFITPQYLDARISLPIGALLSCVFLQQSYSSALPDVGYMVLMDKIYLLSYLLIAFILLRTVLMGNRMSKDEKVDVFKQKKADRRLAMVFLGFYCLGIMLVILI
jgi:hypothetical protein